MNLFRNHAVLGVDSFASASATGVTSGSVYDLSGYESVAFIVKCESSNASNSIKAQGGTASGSLSDLAGTNLTFSGKVAVLELYRPQTRYGNAVVTRNGAADRGDIIAIGINPRVRPSSHGGEVATKFVNSPDTGTATSS